VTHIPIARQQLGKHTRNTHAANNTGEVFSMSCTPKLFARRVVTHLCNSRGSGVFCTEWTVPRLYKKGSLEGERTKGMGMQQNKTEYNRDYRIGIGSSEVVQQSTRMRTESVIGWKEPRVVSS
jgi:hypothetical protein